MPNITENMKYVGLKVLYDKVIARNHLKGTGEKGFMSNLSYFAGDRKENVSSSYIFL